MPIKITKVPGIVVGHPFPKSLRTVMGVDVSTDTGIVVLQWDAEHNIYRTKADYEINLPSLPKAATMRQRVNRCLLLQQRFIEALDKYCPTVVAIEGFGYANAHSLVTLVEFGTAVRLAFPRDMVVLEVSPASLKKFILGKGVGKKEQVMMQVFKRYGYEAQTNNLADAYVLAQIAAAFQHGWTGGKVVATKPQVEVLAVVEAKNA